MKYEIILQGRSYVLDMEVWNFVSIIQDEKQQWKLADYAVLGIR